MLDFLSMVTTKWKGKERLVSCDSISPTPCRASPHPPTLPRACGSWQGANPLIRDPGELLPTQALRGAGWQAHWPGGSGQTWAGASRDSCARLSPPGNGYVSARASPGLLPVANGNSLNKVVPAKSPPPPTHSAQLGAPSRKPDLRVITSQGGKGLMHHLVSGGPAGGLGAGERAVTSSQETAGGRSAGLGQGAGAGSGGAGLDVRPGRGEQRCAAGCGGGWGGGGQGCGAGGRTLSRPLVLFLLPDRGPLRPGE